MIKGNRILAGLLLTLSVGAFSGAAAVAEEGAQQNEAPGEEDAVLQLVEDEGEPVEASSAQPGPDGQGQVEIDPESAAGACPGGTAMKIDGLRSNGTFGPITISDYTNTSFSWTSTQVVSAVLVKDGGGHKTNPGGTSGSASTFGQDISHVIFCLGGDVPEVDAEAPVEETPCDADETMPGTQPCEAPCDADETMPGTQPCETPCDADETRPGTQPCETPCDADESMPGTQPCEKPCDADESMPGTQPCAPPCDGDETMPGRQDCTEDNGVAGAGPNPEKDDDDVQGAGLVADREPEAAPTAVQPMAAQPVVQGSALPVTGGQTVPLLMIAAGFFYAGAGAVLFRRP